MHCLMCFRHTPIIVAPPTCWQSDTLVGSVIEGDSYRKRQRPSLGSGA